MRSTNLSTTSTLNSGTGKGTLSTTSNSGAAGKRTSAPNQTAQSEAEKFLTLGISHHESGDLSRSAFYFERSAKIEGGCVVGMCMWGMALREGWGVRKDQKRGFEWISRAASRAGDLMATSNGKTRNEAELKAIRSELKLSVYELGKCFCYGWGVKQDRQMALEYFELAAKLGDADAQAEAGALLAAGKGCKKDLKKAAMYYRMAEAQGYDTVGLSWIHKDKYDPVSVGKTKGGR
ncbi:HCP-like protein [Meira miltonrushii]|uniref:HCP-like protein n=1 Tax=Meira miltonrushii TaxID=1280837 RepID=A0A316VCU5_9BASI|nr:HCP-like protein [Meira miltonrushii]PWN35459.1 HCP-like protein [Meira miltonrushii]